MTQILIKADCATTKKYINLMLKLGTKNASQLFSIQKYLCVSLNFTN